MRTYQPQPPPPPHDSLVETLLETVVVSVFRLLWWLIRHPVTLAIVAVPVTWSILGQPRDAIGATVTLAAVLAAWRLAHRRSFDRLVGRRFRRRWRKVWRYELRWRSVMTWNNLILRHGHEPHFPRIRKLECSAGLDRIRVQMLLGQTPETYEQVADALAHGFGARTCRVRRDGPGIVWLEFAYADALARTIPALPIDARPDLNALPIGLCEDGRRWTLRLAGTHVLVAGVTGAGKGSVIWSMIRSMAPLVADGVVELWVIDPKGGMELAPGRALFARFEADRFEAMAGLLDEAVALMKRRARRLAGVARRHEPSTDDPLVVVIIDEVANLTAYIADRKLRERISQSLGVLLTQGRAVGVNVVAALQDPRKEILGFRNLFPTRIALRLDERQQVDMVLGDGARDRGALCDQISDRHAGIGYARLDGQAEPVRVRAAYVIDADIEDMARDYPAPRQTAGVEVER